MIDTQTEQPRIASRRPEDRSRWIGVPLPAGLVRWWPAAWGVLVGLGMFAVTWQAMPDDALITLSFVRNLVDRGEWAITPGLEVNTATSPLMVWLEAAFYLASGKHAIVAAGALLAACLAAIATMLRRLGGTSAALLGPVLLATSPWLTASVGMETVPGIALLLALVLACMRRRWVAVALAVAATPLLRPDLVVGALAVLALCAAVHRTWARTALSAAAGAVLVLPWYAFSWWHFGSVWPLTLPVKALQSGWGPTNASLATALPFLYAAAPVSTAIVVVGLLTGAAGAVGAALRGRWPDGMVPAALLVGGVGEFVALAAVATTPVIYYPGILIGSGACALAVASGWWPGVRWPGVLIVVAGVAYLASHASDLAEGNHPMRQNWATNHQFSEVVRGLPTDAPVLSAGEVGALSFYCLDHGCRVVDPSLADPGRVSEWNDLWLRQHPWATVNYRHLAATTPIPTPYRIEFRMFDDPANPPFPDCRTGDVTVFGGGHVPGTARVIVDAPRRGAAAAPH